jgi:hypothetical protein
MSNTITSAAPSAVDGDVSISDLANYVQTLTDRIDGLE